MARSLNKCCFIGNLGKDPETKYMPSGTAVTNVSIACTEQWKDKDSGEQREHTEWIQLAFFGRLAEIAGDYLRKGSRIYVETRVRTRKWQDRDGNDRYTTEFIVGDLIMLDSKGSGEGGGSGSSSAGRGRSQQRAPAPPDDFDDDIPF